jgi:hypothetical protein
MPRGAFRSQIASPRRRPAVAIPQSFIRRVTTITHFLFATPVLVAHDR